MLGISKEIVHQLPEVTYPGRVILIDSAAKARDAVAYLLKQRQIGFDTETRPSFQKNHRYKVSLVQLSTPGECFLFRLKMIGSLDGLVSVLENAGIQKIGLSLKDDFHSLAKLCEFTPAGFVELQTFVKNYEIADNSLQKIYALIFGKRISKNQRLTNWEAAELTVSQQNYAAIDAWACVEIYNFLRGGRFNPADCPYKIDDETAIMLQNSVGIHLPLKHPGDPMELQTGEVAPVPFPVAEPAKKKKTASRKKKTATETSAEQPAPKKTRSRKSASAKAAGETAADKPAAPGKTAAKKTSDKKSAVKKTAAKKPAEKKATIGKTAEKPAPAKKKSASRKSASSSVKSASSGTTPGKGTATKRASRKKAGDNAPAENHS